MLRESLLACSSAVASSAFALVLISKVLPQNAGTNQSLPLGWGLTFNAAIFRCIGLNVKSCSSNGSK